MDEPIARVLLIEDLQMAQKVAEKFFAQLNCQLHVVPLASMAFEKLLKNKYDIIFTDVHLPDINGLDFVQAFRSCENKNKRIPIVAVTAMTDDQLEDKARYHGCDHFLAKPLSLEMLRCTLIKLMQLP